MPPRRRPRSWLAGRLRSAAGAVQRLAGRVEPAGHLPPPQTPVVAARRFGEPPRHWVDLVAAHAPGLLHDLDLDPSPAGTTDARVRDGGQDESTGLVDADGAGPVANARSDGSGRLGGQADVGGPGASGDKRPTRLRAERRTGRSGRPSRAGDRPDGTGTGAAHLSADLTPSSSSDLTTPPAGSTWPDGPTPPAGSKWPAEPTAAAPPVRRSGRVDTTALDTAALDTTTPDTAALDASGLPRADGPRQPVPSMVFGPHSSPSGRPHRAEAEATRTTAGRLPAGRDGFRGDSDGQPSPREDQSGHPRGGAPSAARTSRVDAVAAHRLLNGPNRGGTDASRTGYPATSAGNPAASTRGDLDRLADGGPWLALPGEPAPPGPPAALRDTGVGSAGGGRATGVDGPPGAVTRSVDPWPALPDDTTLWSVAGTAVDTAQLTRLDREQAGD
ncbi:hypothetical protein [Micromonospora sp. NPDC047187]|uniref:hypothetical protein n=1 Tax=Micromonospora sp. NPDC047187 TaxID=3155262 RepID=UPI0033D1EAC6